MEIDNDESFEDDFETPRQNNSTSTFESLNSMCKDDVNNFLGLF